MSKNLNHEIILMVCCQIVGVDLYHSRKNGNRGVRKKLRVIVHQRRFLCRFARDLHFNTLPHDGSDNETLLVITNSIPTAGN